jgi:hypothetical protein
MESTAVESMEMHAPADAGARGGTSSAQSQRAVGDNRRGQDGSLSPSSPCSGIVSTLHDALGDTWHLSPGILRDKQHKT